MRTSVQFRRDFHACFPAKQRESLAMVMLAVLAISAAAIAQQAGKAVGTVKSVSGDSVVILGDSGAESTITFADSARVLRAAPGQTDLKSAVQIQISDIQVGDRIFARGQPADNGGLVAASVLVMKKTDIAQKQQAERDEWRRGIGGIVKSVDVSAGTITIANSLAASGKAIVVHVGQQTSIRRYAADSIKFDDAQAGTIDQIKSGDQLRARGTKNSDATEFSAQAIVSGTFRDIAGTVVSTDAGTNSVTVMDLARRKPVVIHVTGDSELRKLPPPVATRIAMRLKGGAPDAASGESGAGRQGGANGATAGSAGNPSAGSSQSGDRGAWPGRGSTGEGGSWQGGNNGAGQSGNWHGNGGAADFQQMLSRMPAISISDLNKGDAVMLVATEGTSSSGPTAITMISGVEAILSAAPGGSGASFILSPWNLGAGQGTGGGDAATQ